MLPPRSSMSMRSRTRNDALACREIAANRGLVSSRSTTKLTGDSGLNAERCIRQHQIDHPLDDIGFDRRVGPAFDVNRGMAATSAEQHVDDRIDQIGIERAEAVVVPFLGLEHREHRRQRNGIEIVAEANRRDAVERHFDVVGREIAQRRRHQPDQPVENDFQHRQPFIRHHRRVDDGADAGFFALRDFRRAKAQQAVDFFLVQQPLGAALAGRGLIAAFNQRRPLRRGFLVDAGAWLRCRRGSAAASSDPSVVALSAIFPRCATERRFP